MNYYHVITIIGLLLLWEYLIVITIIVIIIITLLLLREYGPMFSALSDVPIEIDIVFDTTVTFGTYEIFCYSFHVHYETTML